MGDEATLSFSDETVITRTDGGALTIVGSVTSVWDGVILDGFVEVDSSDTTTYVLPDNIDEVEAGSILTIEDGTDTLIWGSDLTATTGGMTIDHLAIAEPSSDLEIELYFEGDTPMLKGDGWEINLKELASTYKTHTIQNQTIFIGKEEKTMSLTSISGILLVMLICVITVKFVIPRFNLKYLFRKFWRWIYTPAQEAKAEWEEVKKEEAKKE